ncbi:MAG TPA: type II toxin-antitoxin system HicB family antitoxin [Planctomycetaceae bacterium]|jgi:predicted RNase H-like HicB family nuclease
MRLKIVFERSDDGGFTVLVPALPGCISEGETLDEARRNIREAIELYLEPGDKISLPQNAVEEEIVV